MIISASRRTDIPSCYSDWFFRRIKEGFVLTRNPRNTRRISRIRLTPDVVDGIVFWTKNPAPMLARLDELKDYPYYFQFTVTPYGKDIEPNLPAKNEAILTAFKRLSDKIGADRVIWRYDPILLNSKYHAAYHARAFQTIAAELRDYTRQVTISFIDTAYRGVKSNTKALALSDFPPREQIEVGAALASIARGCGLAIHACAERADLRRFGIESARCIDGELFEKLLGCRLRIDKDKTQRPECGCAASIDIGAYNTCRNGCRYCYANYSPAAVAGNAARHDPFSPLISGDVTRDDTIHERGMKSCLDAQTRI